MGEAALAGEDRAPVEGPLEERLASARLLIEARLLAAIQDLPDSPVRGAMRHALMGGKRLRGFLVIEGARLHGLTAEHAASAAAAIEAMHAYSLVHDDLPCMDDDDMRRGRPSVHAAFGETVAVLAGDALQTLSFGLLARDDAGSAQARLAMIAEMARAAGAAGMVLGQMRDIEAEGREMSLEETEGMQAAKTGALFVWSARAGAHVAGADPAPLEGYARALGLAFQIADDLIDATGDEAAAGKRTGKDAEAGKATFVGHLGVDGARARAEALAGEAQDALAGYGEAAATLRALALKVVRRDG